MECHRLLSALVLGFCVQFLGRGIVIGEQQSMTKLIRIHVEMRCNHAPLGRNRCSYEVVASVKPNGFGGEVGLDWGGGGLVLGLDWGGTRREDGAGVASLLLRIGDVWGEAWE